MYFWWNTSMAHLNKVIELYYCILSYWYNVLADWPLYLAFTKTRSKDQSPLYQPLTVGVKTVGWPDHLDIGRKTAGADKSAVLPL